MKLNLQYLHTYTSLPWHKEIPNIRSNNSKPMLNIELVLNIPSGTPTHTHTHEYIFQKAIYFLLPWTLSQLPTNKQSPLRRPPPQKIDNEHSPCLCVCGKNSMFIVRPMSWIVDSTWYGGENRYSNVDIYSIKLV